MNAPFSNTISFLSTAINPAGFFAKSNAVPFSIKKLYWILLGVFYLFSIPISGQTETKWDSLQKLKKEEEVATTDFIKELAKKGKENGELNFKNNKLFREQSEIFTAVSTEIQKVKTILKKGIDYKNFSNEFKIILKWKEESTQGITVNKHKIQTVRDLTTTSILLDELHNRTNFWLDKIKINYQTLSESQQKLDSLSAYKSLYVIPTDSISKNIYLQRYVLLSKDLDPLSTKLNNALDSIQILQIQGNILKFSIESDIVETNLLRKDVFDNLTKKKINAFVANSANEKSFLKSLVLSIKKAIMVLTFYYVNHFYTLLFMLLLFGALLSYLIVLKRKYIDAEIYQKLNKTILILNYPIAAALLVTITLFQFFLPLPPFIFNSIIWLFSGIALTYILWKTHFETFIFRFWLLLLPIFTLAILNNLILIHTVTDTWLIIGTAGLTLLAGWYGISNRKKLNNSLLFWTIIFTMVSEFVSIIYTSEGYYNFGKIMMTNGIYTLLLMFFFTFTFYILKDIVLFSNYLKETEEEKRIDSITDVKHTITTRDFFFFFLGWFIITKRNNYSFQSFFDPIIESFSEVRQIGDFSFSYQSIFLFIAVLLISGFISRIVSFLATTNRTNVNTETKSAGLGSWLLLIRIAIISLGILIAFASAGIPIDKIALIISALSVGIGFGLQTVINNLVSGLIIAFEKPVNLDDIIEINGQTGKMKSIGIRSSVITTWDGADVIIPNGDLLSQHLTNWTLGSSKRRFEIQVGVAYGTNLTQAKNILEEVLLKHHLILKNPMPMIWVSHFNESSIDFTIKYWVPHFDFGNDVKSELLITIDQAFKDNDIVIPFPQQDIHIQSLPDTNKKEKTKKETK